MQEALKSGNSTADVRADTFVRGWLDDETVSRLDSYDLRLQINALPGSEYKGSNHAILEGNPIYSRFTALDGQAHDLGLTSAARDKFLVENSRVEMGRYSDHLYRNLATDHVVSTFNLNPADTASLRAHVATTFHSPGYTVESQTYDDGSSHVWVRHEDGSFAELTYDIDGRRFSRNETAANGDRTSTFYGSDGHVIRVIETDGAHDNSDYASRTTLYDAQGRTDMLVVAEDDGSYTAHDYDQANERGDSVWSSRHDAQDRLDWSDVTQDDGSHVWTDYDQAGVRADSTWQSGTDASGRDDWQYVTNDDGSHVWTDFDQAGVRGDRIWQSGTDASGRNDWQYVTSDDGSHVWTDYDQSGVRGDSVWQNRTDAEGREDWRSVTQDDGSRDMLDFDQTGAQGWSRLETHFDGWGRQDFANMFNDDGSRNVYDQDQDGSRTWSESDARYDVFGRQDYSIRLFDDGTRFFVDFDAYGLNQHKLLAFGSAGQVIYSGEEINGVVVTASGAWNAKYGEGLGVQVLISGGSGGAPTHPPIFTPFPVYDPYPDAHVEVGPLEPVGDW